MNNLTTDDIMEIEQLKAALLELQKMDFLNQLLPDTGPNGCKTINECQSFCSKQANFLKCQMFFSSGAGLKF